MLLFDDGEVGTRDLSGNLAAGLLVGGLRGAEACGRGLDGRREVAHDVDVIATGKRERVADIAGARVQGAAIRGARADAGAELREQARARLLQGGFRLADGFDRRAQRAVVLERLLYEGNQLSVLEDAVVGDGCGWIARHRRNGPVGRHASALHGHRLEGWLCDGEVAAAGEEGREGAHGHAAGHLVINHVSAPGLGRVELHGGQGKNRRSHQLRPPPPVQSR